MSLQYFHFVTTPISVTYYASLDLSTPLGRSLFCFRILFLFTTVRLFNSHIPSLPFYALPVSYSPISPYTVCPCLLSRNASLMSLLHAPHSILNKTAKRITLFSCIPEFRGRYNNGECVYVRAYMVLYLCMQMCASTCVCVGVLLLVHLYACVGKGTQTGKIFAYIEIINQHPDFEV